MMQALYNSEHAKNIDQLATQYLAIDSFALMQKAASALFLYIKSAPKVLVITGPGNNGGDGWVLAELARQNGQDVTIWALKNPDDLTGDAKKAALACEAEVTQSAPEGHTYDVIVDGIFGSGLNKEVTGRYAQAIQWINRQNTKILTIDIPSGLNADTGQVMGTAVQATQTVSILTLKPGFFLAQGKDHVGDLQSEPLSVPDDGFKHLLPVAVLLHQSALEQLSQNRSHNSHKGSFGHVWAVGGQAGMMGAVLLAAHASLRVGAGAVTAVTDSQHSGMIPLHLPEIMSHGFDSTSPTLPQKPASTMVLGVGLGQSQWSQQLLQQAQQHPCPKVYDADALNLLNADQINPHDVITPHPLEAAKLLKTSTEAIQTDRLQAARQLQQKLNCVVVLKGAGTIVCDAQQTSICPYGSDALATAGSGDVLAGMIAGLMAQGHESYDASCLAVIWHAVTGERSQDQMCLTASGILVQLPLHLPG